MMCMKIINRIFTSMVVLVLITSCVDLNYTEVTTNDEDWIYKSPLYGIQQLVTSVYARIPNGFDKNYEGGSGSTLAAATDEADCAISTSSVHRFYNGGWSPNNPFSFTWENSYKAIAEANTFLEKLDKIDLSAYQHNSDYEAMKTKFELFEYEVRFLRAYFYFELVRAYGDVPFALKSLTNAEANSLIQTPAVVVFDWIIEEMDLIAGYLPISHTTELSKEVGRANRLMCLALKARTQLYKASPLFNTANRNEWWLEAARSNYEVIRRAAMWGVSLDEYNKVWGANNGDGVEVIFASKQGSFNSWEVFNYPVGVENGTSGMCPTQTLVDAYEYEDDARSFGERFSQSTINLMTDRPYDKIDPRFNLTIVRNGDLWPNYNTRPIETFEGGVNAQPLLNATQTGYYLKKYCDANVNISTNNATTTPHAWVLMRLGEFYLNFAEAMYHYYGDAEALGEFDLSANAAINALRNRADVQMPNWSGHFEGWQERYQRERMVELAFENQRFWDVRRWKQGEKSSDIGYAKLTKEFNGSVILTRHTSQRKWNDKYYFFPIPFSELNKNPNLRQNEGWN